MNILGLQGVFADVVVGLIGAGIVALFGIGIARARDSILSQRFPLRGVYRSVFEDTEDGKITSEKAIATLHQRGRRVWGPTTLLNGERTWNLDGHIDDGGRIWGRYTSDDPHDNGLGAFFLELQSDGHLEGMWTGYDSVNKLVSTGRYVFWPIVSYPTSPMIEAQLDGALSVLGNALGARYVTREELAPYILGGEKRAFVAISKQSTVVGAATIDLPISSDGILGLLPDDQIATVVKRLPELSFNRTGLLRSVAVSPKARGHGIATDLIKAAVDSLWADGATNILSIGWTDEQGCHIQGPLQSIGFESQGDVTGFWTEDSIKNDYGCPSCGTPCKCTARLFVLSR